jgi:aromatic ring-cleaving dioxygenase
VVRATATERGSAGPIDVADAAHVNNRFDRSRLAASYREMTTERIVMPEIHGYHAHVYYADATLPVAERVRQRLAANFPAEPGAFSGREVGPHPVPQFQIIFEERQFKHIVPWLMLNREGLDVLVHPLTNDMVDDHTIYALWLGTPVALKLETMQRRGYGRALLPKAIAEAAV